MTDLKIFGTINYKIVMELLKLVGVFYWLDLDSETINIEVTKEAKLYLKQLRRSLKGVMVTKLILKRDTKD